jgi:hypothetical protein
MRQCKPKLHNGDYIGFWADPLYRDWQPTEEEMEAMKTRLPGHDGSIACCVKDMAIDDDNGMP